MHALLLYYSFRIENKNIILPLFDHVPHGSSFLEK